MTASKSSVWQSCCMRSGTPDDAFQIVRTCSSERSLPNSAASAWFCFNFGSTESTIVPSQSNATVFTPPGTTSNLSINLVYQRPRRAPNGRTQLPLDVANIFDVAGADFVEICGGCHAGSHAEEVRTSVFGCVIIIDFVTNIEQLFRPDRKMF